MKQNTLDLPDVQNRIEHLLTKDGGNDCKWARVFGCDRKTVFCYRHGISSMPVAFFRKLCEVTKVSADWVLFGGEESDRG